MEGLTELSWPLPQFDELYIHDSVWDSEISRRVRNILEISAQRVNERPIRVKRACCRGQSLANQKKDFTFQNTKAIFLENAPALKVQPVATTLF